METHAKTVRLPGDLYARIRQEAFARKMPQNTLLVEVLTDWANGPCPDCAAPAGGIHDPLCDVPSCPVTGRQRLLCRDMDGHACGDVAWKGYGHI